MIDLKPAAIELFKTLMLHKMDSDIIDFLRGIDHVYRNEGFDSHYFYNEKYFGLTYNELYEFESVYIF